MVRTTLKASDTLRSGMMPLDAARACAARVVAEIAAGNTVALSFHGFRGASSSYFNAFWLELISAVGVDGLSALEIQTGSKVLADVIERSRRAAVNEAVAPNQPARRYSVA